MTEEMRIEIIKTCRARKYSGTYRDFWLAHHRCECCGKTSAAPHHIRTRGAGGDDNPLNLLALCTSCHTTIHQLGAKTFGEQNPKVKQKIRAALERSRERVTGLK